MTLNELIANWKVVQIDFTKAPPMGMCFAAGFAHGFERKEAVGFDGASQAGREAYENGFHIGRRVITGEIPVPDYIRMPVLDGNVENCAS